MELRANVCVEFDILIVQNYSDVDPFLEVLLHFFMLCILGCQDSKFVIIFYYVSLLLQFCLLMWQQINKWKI